MQVVPSLNIIGILLETLVCVKAATSDALDDNGPLRSPKYAPAIMAPATIFSGILPALAIVMSTMPMVPTVPKAVPNSMLTIAVNKKARSNKEGWINQVDAGGDNHRDDACCLPHSNEPTDKQEYLHYYNRAFSTCP